MSREEFLGAAVLFGLLSLAGFILYVGIFL
jgi:hypothetical protein